jgi:hypothetical protein
MSSGLVDIAPTMTPRIVHGGSRDAGDGEGLTAQGARVAPAMFSQRAAFTHGVIDGRTAQEFEPDENRRRFTS